jgi:succinate-semialdehyde dehydrogenase / glutarate-semialdehyde dehydrogenase
LELGGKDAALVFDGSDLEHATSSLLWGSVVNCGHSCLSIERIYVQESIFDVFLEKIVEQAQRLKLAYPSVFDGQIGPIMPIVPFKNEDEAIALANSTVFGLSGAVFASTWEEAYRIGQRMEAGAISINDSALTAIVHDGEKNSFKASGMGGTRMGPSAIKRFMRQKAYLVKKLGVASPWWF